MQNKGKIILHSDWGIPKKAETTTSTIEISEEEYADRRIKAWADLSVKMECPEYKLRIPTSEELRYETNTRRENIID